MEAAIPLSGQVVGRIDAVKSADEILQDTMSGFYSAVARLASTYTAWAARDERYHHAATDHASRIEYLLLHRQDGELFARAGHPLRTA